MIFINLRQNDKISLDSDKNVQLWRGSEYSFS